MKKVILGILLLGSLTACLFLESSKVSAQSTSEKNEVTSYYDILNQFNFFKNETSLNQQEKFINDLSPSIRKTADTYHLYGSVMMAQAILESAWGRSELTQKANNYFGIKGTYQGLFYEIETKEYLNGEWVVLKEKFRKYPTIQESMNDNGDKLRNGVSWDPNYYCGTWLENTKSYKDAANFLTGKYATDPNYGAKIIQLIEQYSLNDLLDYDKIILQNDMSIVGYLKTSSDTIRLYAEPYFTSSKSRYAKEYANSYSNQSVEVLEEAITSRNNTKWWHIKINGVDKGWVDSKYIQVYDTLISQTAVNYSGYLKTSSDTIRLYAEPYFTSSKSRYAKEYANSYSNQSVEVLEEAITSRNNTKWWHIKINGVDKGWVDSKYIQVYDTLISQTAVNYSGYLKTSSDTIRLYAEPYF
ncbi:MAG: glucosaminidase domain-containing protein, partial [Enterococcus sp.]|uniref:glucosaminidase domain-containing protein n=2 Tax=Enterococcus sp. TaxID=35783 RepID=UPI002FC652FF